MVQHGLEILRQRIVHTAGGAGNHPQHAARLRHSIRQQRTILALEAVERGDGTGLEGDAPRPAVPQHPEHPPGGRVARREAFQVGADGDRAVGIGGAQAELETRLDVGVGPALAVRGAASQGAEEIARGIVVPWPDMALVQMGMAINRAGPELPAIEARPLRRGAERGDGGDAAMRDLQVEAHQPLPVDRARCLPGDQRRGGAGVAQPVIRPGASDLLAQPVHRGTHRRSPCPMALSCQRRSSKCDSRLKARKMPMPAAEISTRAANMRGICNW